MNKNRSENFFTPAELEQISLAVANAEKSTSGEIATMVVDRSARYREAATLGAVLGAATLALVVAVAAGQITIWSYLPVTLLLFFPALRLIRSVPALQKPFISKGRMAEAVRERAIRAFYEKGLYRTREATGILIFISIFERKVWILGDRGINACISPDSWTELVQTLVKGIREDRACESLCEVIRLAGEKLAHHFPINAEDSNELHDEILVGR